MKKHTVDKLRAFLSGDIDSEYKVVYLLCECRKLLDHSVLGSSAFALRMYCNWALHVDLTRNASTTRFLQQVDGFVASVLAGNADIVAEHRMFREFLFLETFQKQLRDLLATYALPTRICDDQSTWHQFLTHYAGVIEDGSLSCDADPASLKLVERVIFNKGPSKPAAGFVPFSLLWKIVLLDSRWLDVEVHATPLPSRREPMLVHGIRLGSVQ